MSLCHAAQLLYPEREVESSCPLLKIENGKALCSLIATEIESGIEPVLQMRLGAGKFASGCGLDDDCLEQIKGMKSP